MFPLPESSTPHSSTPTPSSQPTNHVYFGDCRTSMQQMVEQGVKVQTCVTSPPYFGLRDYGHGGQIGLESTVDEYVSHLVEVFRLVRELLTEDGTLWLNLGDSYNGSGKGGNNPDYQKRHQAFGKHLEVGRHGKPVHLKSLKPKDLIGIPWRVAFALQADGWFLRQDIIWAKNNPMPESVKDRCTKSHEYVFLLSKNKHYYFDHTAILEPAAYDGRKDTLMKGSAKYEGHQLPNQSGQSFHARGHARWQRNESGAFLRNKRSVWTVSTKPFNGKKLLTDYVGSDGKAYTASRHCMAHQHLSRQKWGRKKSKPTLPVPPHSADCLCQEVRVDHFAVYPPALIEPCILAGSRLGDVVFDPFFGSGTTGVVAQQHGRQWLGCELNETYAALQQARLSDGRTLEPELC